MNFILDENVCYGLVQELRSLGFKVISIAEDFPSLEDSKFFALLQKEKGFLFTRDYHFTNPIRFYLHPEVGIIFLRLGNIKASEEISLALDFAQKAKGDEFGGKLITVSRDEIKIR